MITKMIIGMIVRNRRKSWKKTGTVFVDDSAMVFFQTALQPGMGKISNGKRSCVRGDLKNIGGPESKIIIGDDSYIGENTKIWAYKDISVGNHVNIAHNVSIFDSNTHPTDYLERRDHVHDIIWGSDMFVDYPTLQSEPVVIEDDVWIGCNCVILKGVKVGQGAIVGAGSVVTRDIAPWTVVAGNPAVKVKELR